MEACHFTIGKIVTVPLQSIVDETRKQPVWTRACVHTVCLCFQDHYCRCFISSLSLHNSNISLMLLNILESIFLPPAEGQTARGLVKGTRSSIFLWVLQVSLQGEFTRLIYFK
jgi:hypothetical protein